MSVKESKLLTGYEIVVQAARDAGAKMMYSYPITPTSDIFSDWIKRGEKYLQTEDEIAAGFAVCGAVMAGEIAFTATAGPGHVLMQDALSMAEGMRLPFVAIVGQRGGPSSGTVIYSQQEVVLACHGGNGEGLRFVYSPSSPQELYELTVQAFRDAWQYNFPAILLTDGYLLKAKSNEQVIFGASSVPNHPLVPEKEVRHWQNIYSLEEELHAVIKKDVADFREASEKVVRADYIPGDKAEILLVAHGTVAASALSAIESLKNKNVMVSLFRPVTLNPFPRNQLREAVLKHKKIVIVESSAGQLKLLFEQSISGIAAGQIFSLSEPALGIEPETIEKYCLSLL